MTAHGAGVPALEKALRDAQTAVRPLTRFDPTGLCSTLAAESPVVTTGSRPDGLLSLAADEALAGLDLKPDARRGLMIGTTKGRLADVLERRTDDPFAGLCAEFARRVGARGPVRTLGAACASSSAALGEAFDALQLGQCDEVIVAGVEALHRFVYSGFHALKALSPEPARPFDAQRKGLSMGEAAVVLLLESEERARAHGRKVLAYLDGYGLAMDAHDQTAPHPKGAGLQSACRQAMARAGWEPKTVGRYHAHGTATPHNDRMESAACEALFGPRGVPLTAAKGSVGHTLGAAGALDALICGLALRRRELWAVTNLVEVDPALTVAPVRERQRHEPPTALVATAGFGGVNTSLALSAGDAP
ncbi:MAG: beta-ketoacyl-[acyl-carrier-protein] synthase family protein [Archangiaceae bacterium]|nr:beta-ketoacyl-[acyl-carrier-protein] synthase family protein [Archangiaceae bacterium]